MAETVAELIAGYYEAERQVQADAGLNLKYAIKPIIRHLGDLRPAEFRQAHVERYVEARRAEGVRPPSARRELANLRSALRRVDLMPRLVLPPDSPSRRRVLSTDEVQRLLDAAADQELRLFIVLALVTASRSTALLELTWDRVDLGIGIVDLRAPHARAAKRKGRAVVPISPSVVGWLRAINRREDGQLFTYTTRKMRGAFRRARKQAGLGDDVVPHTLRHTVASALIHGIALVKVSRLLGHSSVAVTERVYIHLTVEDLREATVILDGLVGRLD